MFDKSLGFFFLLLEPILMAGIFYVLTMVVLGSPIGREQFCTIYVSVVFWRWFSRSVDNSPGLFNTYGSVLKQTNFPIYSIVISYIGMEIVLLCFGIAVLIFFLLLLGFPPSLSIAYLPVVMVAQLSLTLFVSLICSIAGTFLKDLQGILYAFTSIWFYFSPGIYPASRIPENYLWLYMMNPFAHILPSYKTIFIEGGRPEFAALFVIFVIFAILSFLAFVLLRKVRYYFFIYL
jgi:lipopolysaccharide transport system permease protein